MSRIRKRISAALTAAVLLFGVSAVVFEAAPAAAATTCSYSISGETIRITNHGGSQKCALYVKCDRAAIYGGDYYAYTSWASPGGANPYGYLDCGTWYWKPVPQFWVWAPA